MTIFMMLEETSLGPCFSTKEKVEKYLDKIYKEDDWREERENNGYPDIIEITLDDEDFYLDR